MRSIDLFSDNGRTIFGFLLMCVYGILISRWFILSFANIEISWCVLIIAYLVPRCNRDLYLSGVTGAKRRYFLLRHESVEWREWSDCSGSGVDNGRCGSCDQ
jgi:hypothetical protein